jgi:hypothetical protein
MSMPKPVLCAGRTLRVAIAATCFALASTSAWADIIRWEFVGRSTATTQNRFTGLPELFPVGSDVTISLTYDSDLIPVSSPPGTAEYHFRSDPTPFDFGLTIGDHDYSWSRQGLAIVRMSASGLVFDAFLSQRAVAGPAIGTSDLWYPEVLEFYVPFAATSTALPTLLPETLSSSFFSFGLQAYGEQCYLQGCGTTGHVSGELTSVRRVPTPSSLMLLSMGLAGTAIWHRRRVRSSRF